jgi:L-rhamnose-H+ transport protein
VTGDWTSGLVLVVAAGLMQGTFMLPTKYTTKWSWENMWLSYSFLAYIVLPWLVASIAVPKLADVLTATSGSTWIKILLFGVGWGLGALTWGLGINYLGLALGFAIILGLTASIGTLVPLVVLSPEKLATTQGRMVLAGVTVMLIGIAICARAGQLKERALRADRASAEGPRKSYAFGLLICILSGVLSPFGNLGFAFGTEMTTITRELGTPEAFVSIPFWAVIILPLFVCNASFCLYLLKKNGTFSKFSIPGTSRYHLLTAAMGVLWFGGMIVYGAGALQLGAIGPSVGWAVLMALIVVVANVWGLLTGEWRGTGSKPISTMAVGLAVLLVAVGIISASNAA